MSKQLLKKRKKKRKKMITMPNNMPSRLSMHQKWKVSKCLMQNKLEFSKMLTIITMPSNMSKYSLNRKNLNSQMQQKCNF